MVELPPVGIVSSVIAWHFNKRGDCGVRVPSLLSVHPFLCAATQAVMFGSVKRKLLGVSWVVYRMEKQLNSLFFFRKSTNFEKP